MCGVIGVARGVGESGLSDAMLANMFGQKGVVLIGVGHSGSHRSRRRVYAETPQGALAAVERDQRSLEPGHARQGDGVIRRRRIVIAVEPLPPGPLRRRYRLGA
jgi:hypothetical protein